MQQVEGKTKKTAYSYMNAINGVSNHYSHSSSREINIYEVDDLGLLTDISDDYSTTGRFAKFGFGGNGTIRNAIATYVRFYKYDSSHGSITSPSPKQKTSNHVIRRSNQNKVHIKSTNNLLKNARYRGNAIGNSQNLFIRNILSNLGNESFSESDWNETKNYFDNKCAYCGMENENLVMEHAIPINKLDLGEHRLGNLVPSCKECNNKKHHANYRNFLVNQPEELAKIQEYMEQKSYSPLSDNENSDTITEILNMAHEEIGQLAQRYIAIINKLL